MNSYLDKAKECRDNSVLNIASQRQYSGTPSLQFVDNRPQAIRIHNTQRIANNSQQAKEMAQMKSILNRNSNIPTQRVIEEEELQMKAAPVLRVENKTGLSDSLKAGVESLSGVDISDVRVHRNSTKPASVQAHAYTQGSDIHVAPGQEKHIAHESWHVVQQKQGRVQPTASINGIAINDNPSLENEADMMGAKAASL